MFCITLLVDRFHRIRCMTFTTFCKLDIIIQRGFKSLLESQSFSIKRKVKSAVFINLRNKNFFIRKKFEKITYSGLQNSFYSKVVVSSLNV